MEEENLAMGEVVMEAQEEEMVTITTATLMGETITTATTHTRQRKDTFQEGSNLPLILISLIRDMMIITIHRARVKTTTEILTTVTTRVQITTRDSEASMANRFLLILVVEKTQKTIFTFPLLHFTLNLLVNKLAGIRITRLTGRLRILAQRLSLKPHPQ